MNRPPSIILLILIYSFILSCASNPNIPSEKNFWLNEDGDSLEKEAFLKRWRNSDNQYSRWDYIQKDSGRIARLRSSLFQTYKSNYSIITSEISKLTGQNYPVNSIFFIQYKYLDDLCSSTQPINKVSKYHIKHLKDFHKADIADLKSENPQLVILNLYEPGIELSLPNSQTNYHYTDLNNFFREKIFRDPTLCGSLALIKPDGEIVVRNGEYLRKSMARILEDEIWQEFFPGDL